MTMRRRAHELYMLKTDGSIGHVPVVGDEDPAALAGAEAQRLGAWAELWAAGLVGRFPPSLPPPQGGRAARVTLSTLREIASTPAAMLTSARPVGERQALRQF